MFYCSVGCQQRHRKVHKVLCNSIKFLSKLEEDKARAKCDFVSHLNSEQQKHLVQLVGRRCVVSCGIGGKRSRSLWDSGSQVSLVSFRWLKQNIGDVEIRDISELLDAELQIEGVDGNVLPYMGYVILEFQMGTATLFVPFLVTKENLSQPLIGFNVIETLAKQGVHLKEFKEGFGEVSEDNLSALVNFLKTTEPERLAQVHTYKSGATIHAGKTVSIPCKVDGFVVEQRTTVVFEPSVDLALDEGLDIREAIITLKKGSTRVFLTISNTSNRDIKILGKIYLGDLHLVKSMTPVEVSFKEFDHSKSVETPVLDADVDSSSTTKQEVECLRAGPEEHAGHVGHSCGKEVNNDTLKLVCDTDGNSIPNSYSRYSEVSDASHTDKCSSHQFDLSDAGHTEDAGRAIQTDNSHCSSPLVCSCGSCDGVDSNKNLDKAFVCKVDATSSGVEDFSDVKFKDVRSDSPSTDADAESVFNNKLQELDLSNLTPSQQEKVKSMLLEERLSFAQNDDDIGDAKDLQLEIKTADEVPVVKSYNSIPRPLFNEVKSHVQDLVNRGWVTKSKSSWSSPVVIVRKKSGEIRLCCDFRSLNSKTIGDCHPLPRVQETLDNLGGKQWFSVMDQTRAYYQGYVEEGSRAKAAFVTPWGFYQWVRIPVGLMNAPGCFQRHMEEVLGDYRDDFVIPYLDDIIIFSDSFDEHIEHIRKVLRRLRERGLKLKLGKCGFFKQEVKFLGRVVGRDGYRMDDDSVKAVTALKDFTPTTIGHVRHLLGLLGYHRRHVKNFARLAKPLTDLLLVKPKAST